VPSKKCTGEGSTGDYIFGVKQSAKLVSGFLLQVRLQPALRWKLPIYIATMGRRSTGRGPSTPARSSLSRTFAILCECFRQGSFVRPKARYATEVGTVARDAGKPSKIARAKYQRGDSSVAAYRKKR